MNEGTILYPWLNNVSLWTFYFLLMRLTLCILFTKILYQNNDWTKVGSFTISRDVLTYYWLHIMCVSDNWYDQKYTYKNLNNNKCHTRHFFIDFFVVYLLHFAHEIQACSALKLDEKAWWQLLLIRIILLRVGHSTFGLLFDGQLWPLVIVLD